MRVQILSNVLLNGSRFLAGKTVDLTDEDGRQLITAGFASPSEMKTEAAPSAPEQEPAKTAKNKKKSG